MSNSKLQIQQVAILGAGVMGAQIAAHFANCSIKPLLYDLSSTSGKPNSFVARSIESLAKLRPLPIVTKETIAVIEPATYEYDLEQLANCDLVIDTISERLDWKLSLYQRIIPYLKANAILVTNTSALSINKLAEGLPESLKPRFFGMHFFNPPRNLHLVELIPHATTDMSLLDQIEIFLVSYLGKGIVRAKDTPNFIGYRIGMFSLLTIMHYAEKYNLAPDIVDALTGSLIGHPKSASYRTLDLVGIDNFSYAVKTMYNELKGDPWHFMYKVPEILLKLINKGALGSKTKGGIYKKEDGKIKVINSMQDDYRLSMKKIPTEIKDVFAKKDFTEIFEALCDSKRVEAKFLLDFYRNLFHYCAYHLEDIAYSIEDLDLAFKWGFNCEFGPFELWQAMGWERVTNWLNKSIEKGKTLVDQPLPAWVAEFKAPSVSPNRSLPVYKKQLISETLLHTNIDEGKTIFEKGIIRLWTLDKKNAVISFKKGENFVDEVVLDTILESVAIAERDYSSLIIWPRAGKDFSQGIKLKEILIAKEKGKINQIQAILTKFQQLALALKYSKIPTIAATRGLVLGGGCEMAMHCDLVVAAMESYFGLVDTKLGLIPAGGGAKEFARSAARDFDSLAFKRSQANNCDPIKLLVTLWERYYYFILRGDITQSAQEAKQHGFLQANAVIVANDKEVLYVAHQYANALAANNYLAPLKTKIKVAGKEGLRIIQQQLDKLLEDQFITAHDYEVGMGLAKVICGGEVAAGSLLCEQSLLDLEQEVFFQLFEHQATQDRIHFMLEKGEVLRN